MGSWHVTVFHRTLSKTFTRTSQTGAAVGGGGPPDVAQLPGRGTTVTGTPRNHSRANRAPAPGASTKLPSRLWACSQLTCRRLIPCPCLALFNIIFRETELSLVL